MVKKAHKSNLKNIIESMLSRVNTALVNKVVFTQKKSCFLLFTSLCKVSLKADCKTLLDEYLGRSIWNRRMTILKSLKKKEVGLDESRKLLVPPRNGWYSKPSGCKVCISNVGTAKKLG